MPGDPQPAAGPQRERPGFARARQGLRAFAFGGLTVAGVGTAFQLLLAQLGCGGATGSSLRASLGRRLDEGSGDESSLIVIGHAASVRLPDQRSTPSAAARSDVCAVVAAGAAEARRFGSGVQVIRPLRFDDDRYMTPDVGSAIEIVKNGTISDIVLSADSP